MQPYRCSLCRTEPFAKDIVVIYLRTPEPEAHSKAGMPTTPTGNYAVLATRNACVPLKRIKDMR